MRFTENKQPQQKTDAEKQADKLRFIERQFDWIGEDWHFHLAHFLEPIKVYSWFRHAKRVDNRIFFDRGTASGFHAYCWVTENFGSQLAAAYPNCEVCLASRGNLISSVKFGKNNG